MGRASAGGARRRESFEAVFCFLEGHESALQISPAAFESRAVGWGVFVGGDNGWMFVSLGVLLRYNTLARSILNNNKSPMPAD